MSNAGKIEWNEKTSTVKKPIKYREVPALNNKFNAGDYSIILERKDRASLAWDFFGRLFNKEEKRYIDEVNVYCTLCLQNLITRQQSNALDCFACEEYKRVNADYNNYHPNPTPQVEERQDENEQGERSGVKPKERWKVVLKR
ncbi:hypothetical protein Bhyg_04250 [Pseudolycoriella hygida]|uniref:Uncharacterized protein n=1 Tax=Pseudolycoriella hygida TaxID=35572 RepID=A0A9Q0NF23_9DIPT|nr:hypothetical protein Bhyg_04250 [Pseudolycoriella hygida]